jgi:hypothetical protein
MLAAQAERRRMQRCALQEPVTIKFWDHGPREISGTVLNASQCRVVRHMRRGSDKHGLALAILRTESERLARREAQPDSSWSLREFALAET